MPTRDNDKRPKAGMPERTLAFCVLHEHKTRQGNAEIERATENAIIDCRAHGMRERDVIANARRFVREWFEIGLMPDPIGNPAVRVLAHSDDEYPLNGKARFVEILTGRGFPRKIAAATIADAVCGGYVQARRTNNGVDYRLTYEPRTRAVYDLAEHVAAMMARHPGGISFRDLRHVACRVVCRGAESGAALIERALNAGVLRCEIRGTGRNRERFIFPNVTNKAKGGKSC